MINERLPYLHEKTMHLTTSPGVYLMKNEKNQIIYIGKAKNLRNRVSSYFRCSAEHLPKVEKMISHIWDYDFIVTGSEYEALLLECNLIKQHKPHYNILLKDDKGFFYIQISDEAYPRITVETKKPEKGQYLGPYTSGFVAKSTVEEVNAVFRLPTCRKKFPQAFRKSRPCLHYHVKKCMGMCQGHISQEEYQQLIQQAIAYIRNGSQASVARMQKEMLEASAHLEFEKAAVLRDRIKVIEKASASQKMLDNAFRNADIIAMADNQERSCVSVIVYRNGRLYDKLHFDLQPMAEESVWDAFVSQFYHNRADLPDVILLEQPLQEMTLAEKMLSQKAGHKIRITIPQKGGGLQLVQMAKENAVEYIALHENRTGRELLAVEALGKLLGLPKVPRYIEAYDISNLASEHMVGGMVVFENGRPQKKAYKRFRIKSQQTQNDYACMQEVIRQRLEHLQDTEDIWFARKPDLILLDGGKGHVHAVLPVVQEMASDIAVFGMVKDSRHRTRAIMADDSEISISSTQNAFQLVTRIQDEVHRYAIAYMHQQHKKRTFRSELTQVHGIGEKTALKLMLYFKTKDALYAADVQALRSAGISEKTALHLYAYLHSPENAISQQQEMI